MARQQPLHVMVDTNGLGTAGFVFSLLGLITCGLLGPIGLAISLFALIWPPRGMATAGVIMGGFTTAIFAFWGFAMIAGLVTAIAGLGVAADAMGTAATQMQTSQAIVEYFDERGGLPGSPEGDRLLEAELQTEDGETLYGPVRYERLDEYRYRITLSGRDRQLDTEDDLTHEYDVREESIEYQMQQREDARAADQTKRDELLDQARDVLQPKTETEQAAPSEKPVDQSPMRSDSWKANSEPIERQGFDDSRSLGEAAVEAGFADQTEPKESEPVWFADQKARTWTTEDKKFSVEATLVQFDPGRGEATITRTDGREITLEIKKLSLDDRNFIRAAAREAAK